jgi:hypothetical protein
MTAEQNASQSGERKRLALRVGPILLAALSGTGLAFVVLVTVMCGLHIWNYDSHCHPIVNDFVSFWSPGSWCFKDTRSRPTTSI